MKETRAQNADKVVITAQKQIEKKLKHLGSKRRILGLILWEYSSKTKNIEPAKFETVTSVNPNSKVESIKYSHKVIVNEGSYYIQALNKKNAIKKFSKHFKSIIKNGLR